MKTINKKTITMTSLAILFATISVVTTMTLAQADIEGDQVNIAVTPTATPTDVDVAVGDPDEYTGTIGDNAELGFIDDDGFDEIDVDLSELTIINAGTNVPDDTFTFSAGIQDGTVDFVDLNGDKSVQSNELTVNLQGVDVFDGSAFITADANDVVVDIDSTDDVSITLDDGPGTLGDIVVTIDGMDWDPEQGAIGAVECGTSDGTTTAALFDEDTLEFTMSSHDAIDTAITVHCTFTPFHGDVEKAIVDCEDIPIKEEETTPCTFSISYSGDSAIIIDTVPAEWQVISIDDTSVDAVLEWSDGNGSLSIDDLSEITIVNPGANVPDGDFVFDDLVDGTIVWSDTNGDKSVQADELSLGIGGIIIIDPLQATRTADSSGSCSFDLGKNKKNNGKSATGITCDAENDDVFAIVTIETRESPDTKKTNPPHSEKNDKFKPTSCGELTLNDGAQAILLDELGDPVLSTIDGLPIVLDETEPLSVDAIENIELEFEC